jgi:hypothetical protein
MGEHPRGCEPLPSVGIACINLSALLIGRTPRIHRKLRALNANIFSLLSLSVFHRRSLRLKGVNTRKKPCANSSATYNVSSLGVGFNAVNGEQNTADKG